MKKYLSNTSPLDELMLLSRKKSERGTYIIVEGESDYKLFNRFIDNNKCKIMPVSGKKNVLNQINNINKKSFAGVIGIVDRDFDLILNNTRYPDNVYYTDTTDIETMILKANYFDNLIFEYCNIKEVQDFMVRTGKSIFDAILDIAKTIGIIRLISEKENLNICFDDIIFDKLIDKETLSINVGELIEHILMDYRNKYLNKYRLVELYEKEFNEGYYLWDICRGHDITEIISLVFKREYYGNGKKNILPTDIEMNLRICYHINDFINTDLYKKLQEWEINNPSWVIWEKNNTILNEIAM